jgi:pimeloyl-ACP methyl ester carboxylesterase
MAALRVLFLHGLESGPGGTKARLLAAHFDCTTPAMPTADFEACVALQAERLRRLQPDVVIGSSFGGAVAVALLQRGIWKGPTLLLAPAAAHYGLAAELPGDVRVRIVHATADIVVPVEESRALARSGSAGCVRLIEVDDDHRLSALVASGRLVALVRDLGAETATRANRGPLDRHIAVFFEEATLWPVLFVLLVHVVLAGGLLLLGAFRQHDPGWIAVLALLAVISGDGVRRARQRGRAAGWVAALWTLSALCAIAGDRLGVL